MPDPIPGQTPEEEIRKDKPNVVLPTNIIPEIQYVGYEMETGIPQEVLEQAREVGDRNRRFWNMLVETIPQAGYSPPQDRQTIILDVGCGRCEERRVLSSFFGGGRFGGKGSENVKLIGIDQDSEAIKKAISEHQTLDFSVPTKTTWKLLPNYEFIQGDATDLSQYPSIPQQADVVIIRHQQISDNEVFWSQIIQQALERVTPQGIILLTSFSDLEHTMLIEKLGSFDCKVLVDKKNPYAKPTKYEEVSIDRNIAVIRK